MGPRGDLESEKCSGPTGIGTQDFIVHSLVTIPTTLLYRFEFLIALVMNIMHPVF